MHLPESILTLPAAVTKLDAKVRRCCVVDTCILCTRACVARVHTYLQARCSHLLGFLAQVDGLEQKLLQVLGTLQDVASKVDGLVEVAAEPSVAAKVLTAERVRELSQRV
eukprot:7062851-Prymnesium_polylepis.1